MVVDSQFAGNVGGQKPSLEPCPTRNVGFGGIRQRVFGPRHSALNSVIDSDSHPTDAKDWDIGGVNS